MKRIAMLGSGFIGRFYADALQGYRSKDKVVSVYSRREESAKKFAQDYNCEHWTLNMEESIAHPNVDVVCISLPNNLHEAAVMLCCKHKKAVITTKPLGRMLKKQNVCLKPWRKPVSSMVIWRTSYILPNL
jgi:predicted dehydrogenase